MDLFFRLQEALKSPLGDLLIFLVVLTLTLSFFYLYFWARFMKNRNLLIKHHFYFKKIEKQMKDFSFIEAGVAHFFGKKQTVSLADGRFAQSYLFYPELTTDITQERLKQYNLALQLSSSLSNAKYIPSNKYSFTFSVDTPISNRDSSSRVSLNQFLFQNTMTQADKEFFLMDLAHTLSKLQELQTGLQENLYHGFLLPNSFVLRLDMVKRITNTSINCYGCAYSLGTQGFRNWYHQVMKRQVYIDTKELEFLKRFSFILSPEQKELDSPHSITPACDFYAFGALCVYLFTEEELSVIGEEHIYACPANWRPFIQECLSTDPNQRPQNFLELKEYFSEPELSITQISEQYGIDPSMHLLNENFQEIKPIFDHIQKIKKEEGHFSEQWHQGYQAIRGKNWDHAFSIFNQLMKQDPQAFNAHLGLALTYFKKGEQDKAKFHYIQAKKIDGKKISSFHRLIAFEV